MQLLNSETTRPRCLKCGAELERASVILGLGQLAERIFDCPRCGYVEVVPLRHAHSPKRVNVPAQGKVK
jgi:DNA-directed RNA polymerase subunit RPC12/RpoP